MIARYRVPIHGTVKKRKPLGGEDANPIMTFPLDSLPNRPTRLVGDKQSPYGYGYTCLKYNIDEGWCEIELHGDEAIHAWLVAALEKPSGKKSTIEKRRTALGLKLKEKGKPDR